MIRSVRILRALAKAAFWALATLLAFFALWFAGNRLLDESPDPNREKFLVSPSDHLPDERNIATGILGLTAPSGEDFVQYGAKVKSLSRADVPWREIQNMLGGPNTLQPTAESQQITCWLDPDELHMPGCLSFEEAPAVLKQNSELLQRYKSLRSIGNYSGFGWPNNAAYLSLAKLAVAEVHIDLKTKRYDDAYRKWRDQVLLARTTLRGPDTWVGKAVGLVAIGLPLPALEKILLADPTIAKKYAAELRNVLRPEGIDGFNPYGVIRGEYVALNNALNNPPEQFADIPVDRVHWLAFHLGQRNRMLNRYYLFAREYAAALGLPWSRFDAEVTRLRENFPKLSGWDVAIDPFGSLFISDYIDGQLKTKELVRQMHRVEGTLRLSTLLVRIVDENVPDTAIPGFLASVERELYDPFSGYPMRWDVTQRRIYFPDPEYPCAFYVSFRVPPIGSTKSAKAPPNRSGKC